MIQLKIACSRLSVSGASAIEAKKRVTVFFFSNPFPLIFSSLALAPLTETRNRLAKNGKRLNQGEYYTQQDMSTDQMISDKSFSVAFVREHNTSNCRRSSISCLRSDHLEIFSLLFFV